MPRPDKAVIAAALLDGEIETKAQHLKNTASSMGEVDEGVQGLVNTTAEYVVLFSTHDGVASKIRVERLRDKLLPEKATGKAPFSLEPINPEWKYVRDDFTGGGGVGEQWVGREADARAEPFEGAPPLLGHRAPLTPGRPVGGGRRRHVARHRDHLVRLGFEDVDEEAVQIQPEEIFVREIRKIKLFRSDIERLRQQGMEAAP